MPRSKSATTAQNSQIKRFVESARALGCDESEEKFDATLAKVARHKPPKDSEDGASKAKAPPSKETR